MSENTLKKLVENWIKIDDNLKELNKTSKSLKEEKQQLNEQISQVMISLKINECNLSTGGKLILKTQSSLSPINKEYIQDTLSTFFQNFDKKNIDYDKLAFDTTEILVNSREANEKTVLKKVKGN